MSSSGPISVRFLRDSEHGGPQDQLSAVAAAFADFVEKANSSIDIAIYDFRLSSTHATKLVADSLTRAADRGVEVRIAFDAGKPAVADANTFAALEADPAPKGTADWVAEHFGGTGVKTKPISAGSQLMHSKYIVRDANAATTPARPSVWTGSTNFTDDAWTLQENNIITIDSQTLAAAYRRDFDEMWASGSIKLAGKGDTGSTLVGPANVGWDFCPGDGAQINAALAARVGAAKQRLVVASMVLTSHEVLAALASAVNRKVGLSGIYDGGQMDPIVRQWKASGHLAAVLANWHTVSAHLSHKQSIPYSPTSKHNFMHLKVLVADDTVTTGSYNFSANAERNAENQIVVTDPDTVNAYTAYLASIVAAYR